jgi:hypothetical protein
LSSHFSQDKSSPYINHDYLLTAIVEKDDPVPRRVCDSLIMCIITAVNEGLRNGGGIGDVLRKPDIKVNKKEFLCTFNKKSLKISKEKVQKDKQ